MNKLYAILDGSEIGGPALKDFSIPVLVAILMVFAILGIIIGITTLIFKLTGLFDMKKQLDANKKNNAVPVATNVENNAKKEVIINEDDMMVAALIASIDYQNEIKSDVRVVSVKEIK